MTDHDLLQAYAHQGAHAQAAFAELVARHLNLVYSAALRQVRATALAEDIAQSVFLDLARHARDFRSDQPLAAWLHVVTRRTAIDTIRRESRRHAREHTAASLAHAESPASPAMPPSSDSPWSDLAPHLDEAVAALPAPDRQAILLRYFENKSLREIGASLGTSDDAAQKRVSRALDQLRTLLTRRGLTVTTATLATDLSAHAIVTAPAALGSAIATTAVSLGTAALHTAATAAAKTVAMTTLKKPLVTAALVLTAGAGLYEATVISRQRDELAHLESLSTTLVADLARTRMAQAASARRLATVEAQIDARLAAARAPASGSDAALEAQIKTWLARVDQLKQLVVQRPDLAIPELQLLTDTMWAEVASMSTLSSTLGEEAALRRTFAMLRQRAENLMAMKLQRAPSAYLKSTDGALPDSLPRLLPHFAPPISFELLSRYELLHTGKLSDLSPGERNRIIVSRNKVDADQDHTWHIGPSNAGSNGPGAPRRIGDPR